MTDQGWNHTKNEDNVQSGYLAVRLTEERRHTEFLPLQKLDELESFKPGPRTWIGMDEFAEGDDIYSRDPNYRPTEIMVGSITPREMAIRKGFRLIKTATCKEDLYTIVNLWASHSISIQVQDMDHEILALEETWARRDARLTREATQETRRAKANRQAQYEALYNDLFARAAAVNATTLAIITGQGDITVAVGGVSKNWSASNVKAMLGATKTRLNGGRLEFVV